MKIISVKSHPRALACILAPVVLLATGCGGQSGSAGGTTQSGQLNVVASFYPFQFVAERVAGDHATVTSLTEPGVEPHDVELTPRQVASVSDARLVIYERSFQAAVDEAVAQSGNPGVLDTTTVVPLVSEKGDVHDHAADGEQHDHADEDGHDHSGQDPHVWLDPANMVEITHAVAAKLAAIDPAHAGDYEANAKALDAELRKLDTSYQTGLASCERTEFITTHAAFGYLARAYGLEQVGINGLSPESEPSPARIAEVQQIAQQHAVTTIFYETLVSPAVAQSIANDLGLTTDVLDPIEGITADSRGEDYLAVMTSNLTALRTANGCR